MKIIFFGTPDIAVKNLSAMIKKGLNIQAVVTRPDKPKGRGLHLSSPPVKMLARENHIEVIQPTKTSDPKLIERLKEIKPDLIVCVAYGGFLVLDILNIAPLGTINLHPSFLPQYRGASPIQWAIIRGEEETGISIFYIGEGMDDGDIILQIKMPIHPQENAEELFERAIPMGVDLLMQAIDLIEQGAVARIKQNDIEATFAPKIKKEEAWIDWATLGEDIINRIRGMQPWPIAYTFLTLRNKEKEFRIFKAEFKPLVSSTRPGTVLSVNPLGIACKDGVILPSEVQLEGKRQMKISEFLRGHQINEGQGLKDPNTKSYE